MGLQQDIRYRHLAGQFRMFAAEIRVGVGTEVKVRPAVKSAFVDMGDVVGNQVIAQGVALIDGSP